MNKPGQERVFKVYLSDKHIQTVTLKHKGNKVWVNPKGEFELKSTHTKNHYKARGLNGIVYTLIQQ